MFDSYLRNHKIHHSIPPESFFVVKEDLKNPKNQYNMCILSVYETPFFFAHFRYGADFLFIERNIITSGDAGYDGK